MRDSPNRPNAWNPRFAFALLPRYFSPFPFAPVSLTLSLQNKHYLVYIELSTYICIYMRVCIYIYIYSSRPPDVAGSIALTYAPSSRTPLLLCPLYCCCCCLSRYFTLPRAAVRVRARVDSAAAVLLLSLFFIFFSYSLFSLFYIYFFPYTRSELM